MFPSGSARERQSCRKYTSVGPRDTMVPLTYTCLDAHACATPPLHRGLMAYFLPKAGLLTRSHRMRLPVCGRIFRCMCWRVGTRCPQAVDCMLAMIKGTYSCGTVGDFHPIPF